jgi:hypothetical protein
MPSMTDSPRLTRAKRLEHAAREARLAQALRDNLQRRKQQARARAPAAPPEETGADQPPGEPGESPA